MPLYHSTIGTTTDEVGAEINKGEWNDAHNVTGTVFSAVSDTVTDLGATTAQWADIFYSGTLTGGGASMTATLAMGGNLITGVTTPTVAAEAANKGYVDANVTSGEVFTWTATHDAAGFALINAIITSDQITDYSGVHTSDDITDYSGQHEKADITDTPWLINGTEVSGNVSTNLTLNANDVTGIGILGTSTQNAVTMAGNITMGTNIIQFSEAGQDIQGNTGGLEFDVPVGDTHDFTINAVATISISASVVNAVDQTFQEDGVDISPIGIHDIWVGASSMWATVSSGCADIAKTELASNNVNIQTLDFDTGTDENAQFILPLPANFDNVTITFEVYWTAASGSGTVLWTISALARSEGDALDAAFTDATSPTADTLTTANDLHITASSADMGLTGHIDGDYIHFNILRDVSGDTLGVDAKLIGVMFHITTNAATAA